MILGFSYAFTGHRDYSAAGHASNPLLPGVGMWFVVLAPMLGGLIYGPLVSRFAPEARGHGVPEVMLAVTQLGGRMRPQVPIVKSLASALCIGSGGSVGREGPIVQIGSALGSVLGQFARVTEPRLRLLVACGAAAGISATFNAPIAGVFFSLELILRSFDAESFGFVVLSSVTADAIGRAAFGSHPFLALPGFNFTSPVELVLTPASAPSPSVSGWRSSVCSTPGKTWRIGSGQDRTGSGPRPAGSSSGCCCSRSRKCMASATRSSSTRSAGTTWSWRCSDCWSRRSSRPA